MTFSAAELDDIIEETNAGGTIFSPMNFMQCQKGVGRPKKKRFGAPSIVKRKETLLKMIKIITINVEEVALRGQRINRKMSLLPKSKN